MPVKNTLIDVHNLLMEQLERLNDAEDDEIDTEIKRSKAMSETARVIVDNANTIVTAQKVMYDYGSQQASETKRILIGTSEDE